MQKRKGFTLVELVIVIAVIAILAGVLIGTFASVINKANESAKMQEMKAAEHDQKANDILEKLNNAQWFGWEDLETKIGAAVQSSVTTALSNSSISASSLKEIKEAVAAAVDTAVAKYAVAQGQDNTQLTAEQVQYIVEQAVSKKGGVTEAQVQAIVTNAVKNLNTQTPLSSVQVQRIVDAAVSKVNAAQLTSSDLATALAGVAKTTDVNTAEANILAAISAASSTQSTLTADEVAAIVAKYVTANGTAKGDFTWYTPDSEDLVIEEDKAAEQIIGLTTISASGETFNDKTITLPENATITLDAGEKFNPIKVFSGEIDGNGATINNVDIDIVYYMGEDGKACTGASAYLGWNSAGDFYGDKSGYGFVDVLDGGTISNVTINYTMTDYCADPECRYTYFGGIAGVVKNGATIDHCTVTGTIYAWNRVGGIVGYVFENRDYNGGKITISNCSVSANIYAKQATNSSTSYEVAGGIAGYVDTDPIVDNKSNLYMINNTFDTTNGSVNTATTGNNQKGTLVGCFNCNDLFFTDGNQLVTGKIVHGKAWSGKRTWNTNENSITSADSSDGASGFKAIDVV